MEREIVHEIESTYPEGSETIMTLAEMFREEGKEKGRQEERLNTTIKLLTKRFGALPKELKSEISELDLVTLEVIIEGIFEYQSLDDIRKYIG